MSHSSEREPKCPKCGNPHTDTHQESVDVGVGVIKGPINYICERCGIGWCPDEEMIKAAANLAENEEPFAHIPPKEEAPLTKEGPYSATLTGLGVIGPGLGDPAVTLRLAQAGTWLEGANFGFREGAKSTQAKLESEMQLCQEFRKAWLVGNERQAKLEAEVARLREVLKAVPEPRLFTEEELELDYYGCCDNKVQGPHKADCWWVRVMSAKGGK